MALFDFLRSKQTNKLFVTPDRFKNNVIKQVQMVPATMEQLRKIDVTSDKELKLEFFFYTSSEEKASAFSQEISKLNYEVHHGQSAGDKKLFIVTGWTTKMRMENKTVENWARQMCELGYKFDCDFDGWGTSPDQ